MSTSNGKTASFIPGPYLIAGDGRFVYALNDRGVNAFCAHVMDAHTGDAELRATARLIAASPSLYEALQTAHMALIGYLPAHRNAITGVAIEKALTALKLAMGDEG